jgi:hypothetical protein
MRHAPLLLAALVVSFACGGASHTVESAARSDSRTISASELSKATQLNLYDYLKASRPRWLVAVGGPRSFPVAVYVNDTELGPVESLRSMGLSDIRLVRYYDASAAQARFNHLKIGPVIQVIPR